MTTSTEQLREELHSKWSGMKNRCNNPNFHRWHRYGGRGIKYNPKWEKFEGFYEDMKDGYKTGLTLDRIDNDKNYSKENCRWSTVKQQANNTSQNLRFTIDGVEKTISEWSDFYGIKSKIVHQRMKRENWDLMKALTTPKVAKDAVKVISLEEKNAAYNKGRQDALAEKREAMIKVSENIYDEDKGEYVKVVKVDDALSIMNE